MSDRIATTSPSPNRTGDEPPSGPIKYEIGLARVARTLLAEFESDRALDSALAHLLTAADVSRVYIYTNVADPEPGLGYTAAAEVVAPGAAPMIDSQRGLIFRYETRIPRWRELLSQGRPVHGLIRDFPDNEQRILAAQDIQSILVLPIFVQGQWAGYIGFDDIRTEREWTGDEIRMLETAANIVGAFLDRQRAETRVRASEEMFRRLFESALEGIAIGELVYDEQGRPIDYRVLDVNPAYSRLQDKSADQVTGRLASRVLGVFPPPRLAQYAEVVATGRPITLEEPAGYKNKYYRMTAFRIQPDRFVIAFDDITKQKQAEVQRERRLKFEGVLEMAGAACHELNQPLQVLTGQLELLDRQIEGKAEVRERLTKIQTALERIIQLTGQIQNITHYETRAYLDDQAIIDINRASTPENESD